jgi:hypothetical protein
MFGVPNEDFFPAPPVGGELIHTRRYEIRTYKLNEDKFLLRGVIFDEKPAGLYVKSDPEPLWVHHMVVDLEVAFPSLEIVGANVEFHERPHTHCTDIVPAYDKLVGLSIARGFNAKVKELFGGPRGCTHIGAMLAAMAPVAIQSTWSMRIGSPAVTEENRQSMTKEQRRRSYAMNLNTCHMWDENGALAASVSSGNYTEVPLSVKKRLTELGRSEEEWLNLK